MSVKSARAVFVALWCVLLVAKTWLAAHMPVFGDEAFYAQESRHLAWAYSDVPALTAWLARLGGEIAGPGIFAIRLPFLLLAAALPWLVVRIAARGFAPAQAWQAGSLAQLLPLAAGTGVLALPDVPMLFAALLCLDATVALLRDGPRRALLLQLAFALALGALAHYRFAAVIVAGAAGLLASAGGRALLRDPRVLAAVAAGALGWLPLLVWNAANAGAGVEFQLLARHPWRLQAEGLGWLPVQALLLTPPVFVLLLATLAACWRRRAEPVMVLLAGTAGVATLGWFVLGFFADRERVSFHWPLAGWLALTVAAPAVLASWPRWARVAAWGGAVLGSAAMLCWLVLVASPAGRSWLATTPAWPDNFAGWDEIALATRDALDAAPPGTRVVAEGFMVGAQLSLALGRDDIAVLPHPLDDKHGRAAQLRLWGLAVDGRDDLGDGPVLLVVEDTARPLKARLQGYDALCARMRPGVEPRILHVDRGRKRFLLWTLPARTASSAPAACRVPALAWIDAPAPGATAGGTLEVAGWAWKPGTGLARVEVLLDGVVVADAAYGAPRPDVLAYWGRADSGDDPRVGFTAHVPLAGVAPGRHALALRLHDHDGHVEDWPEQPLHVEAR